MRYASLLEKASSKEYLRSLSRRRRLELAVCLEYLTEEELSKFSSIDTGYRIARRRYIEHHGGAIGAYFIRYSTQYGDGLPTDQNGME